MLTYPKSTLRILHMLMHSSSGHVLLLPEEFPPLNFSPNWTYGAGQTHIGLCPKF